MIVFQNSRSCPHDSASALQPWKSLRRDELYPKTCCEVRAVTTKTTQPCMRRWASTSEFLADLSSFSCISTTFWLDRQASSTLEDINHLRFCRHHSAHVTMESPIVKATIQSTLLGALSSVLGQLIACHQAGVSPESSFFYLLSSELQNRFRILTSNQVTVHHRHP